MSTALYKSLTPELQQKFRNVKVLLTDVDGVLTDGKFLWDANGNKVLKEFGPDDFELHGQLLLVGPLSGLGRWLRLYTICGIEVKYEVNNIRAVDTVDKPD